MGREREAHLMAPPAYDQFIKARYVFNLLDALGVISVPSCRATFCGCASPQKRAAMRVARDPSREQQNARLGSEIVTAIHQRGSRCRQSRMRDQDHGALLLYQDAQADPQGLRVERGKALVQDEHVGLLQESPREENPAALAVRQLPAGLADDLVNAVRHLTEQ